MSPIGPCIRTLCPQLMVLFGKTRGKMSLGGGGVWVRTAWSHFLFLISRLLRRCDGLASCSYSRAFPAMMGCIPKGKPKTNPFSCKFSISMPYYGREKLTKGVVLTDTVPLRPRLDMECKLALGCRAWEFWHGCSFNKYLCFWETHIQKPHRHRFTI